MSMPVSYMESNIIFDTHGQPYALYTIDPEAYAFQAKRNKQSVIDRVTKAVAGMTGEFYVYLLTKQLSAEQIAKGMSKYGEHPRWQSHVKVAKTRLQRKQPFWRCNLLVMPLKRKLLSFSLDTWQELIQKLPQNVLNLVVEAKEKYIPSGGLDIPKDVIENAHLQANEILNQIRPLGGMRKATMREVEWFLKKPYFRGLPEPNLSIPDPFPAKAIAKAGRSYLRPNQSVSLTLCDAYVKETSRHLAIEHADGQVSYQTFFASVNLTKTPVPKSNSMGREWLYGVLEKTRFPIDSVLHVRIEQPKEAMSKLRVKKDIAENQIEELKGNGQDVPLELNEELQNSKELEKNLRARDPLVHVTTIFAIGAPDEKTLHEYATDFLTAAGNFHTIVTSPGDMLKMFRAFYPFSPERLPKAWELPIDPGIFGAGVPFGTRELGDEDGFWLGSLPTDRPIFMDPRRPTMKLNTSGSIRLVGAPGSGKTYLMQLLTANLLSWGAYGFGIDPKGDLYGFSKIPHIQEDVKFISFTYGSETQFNPFRLAESLGESEAAAFSILELVMNPRNDETRNLVIKNALFDTYRQKNIDMFAFKDAVVRIQQTHKDPTYQQHATILIDHIEMLERHPLGRLLYGRDTGEVLFNKRFIVAFIKGLNLPDRDTDFSQWRDEQRLSAALLYAVATMGKNFLMNLPPWIFKFFDMDEVWVLRKFPAGQRLYQDILRLGRSKNIIAILASQNATDFDPRPDEDDMSGFFGWSFYFKLDSKTQVESALRQLGIDEDPQSWVKTFSEDYKEGFGIVKDVEGRIGEIQIEVIDDVLPPYFNTTPPEEAFQYA